MFSLNDESKKGANTDCIVIIHLRNLLTHTLLFWHFLENLNFESKNILEYIRTMFTGGDT